MSVLAIDFDDVICNSKDVKPGRRMGEPMEWAVSAITRLKQRGHTIIIHTVRGSRPQHVADWLDYFQIPYDQITDIKPATADIYLDDKGLTFRGWDKFSADAYEKLGLVL